MNKSELILPIRFYDDLYDQERFSKQCHEFCQLELVYPSNGLPNFQMKRTSKFQAPTKFYLRNVCTDLNNNYWKQISEGASNMSQSDNTTLFGPWPRKGIYYEADAPGEPILFDFLTIDCEKIVPLPLPSVFVVLTSSTLNIPVTAGEYYSFKLIVDKMIISAGSAFTIYVYDGATAIAAINQAGIYNYDFLCASSNISIIIAGYQYGDDFAISYFQATLNSYYNTYPNDVQLEEGSLKVFPITDGNDVIVYCGDAYASTYNIPNGEYYYVVVSGLDYYISEPFKIISLKEIEKYFKLTWWNECDINQLDSVMYNISVLNCAYRNVLYLDADLFKSEYETLEEGEENGSGDLSVQYQKWRKNLNFEVGKSPEFLTDALTGIFLHDNILIKKPLNHKQEIQSTEYEVLKVVNNVSQVLDDCFQNVKLKFLLEDKFIDTGCCTFTSVFDCTPCKYVAGDNCESFGYNLVIPPAIGPYGLYSCATGQLVNVRPTELICYNDKYYTLELIANVWTVTGVFPAVTAVNLVWFWYIVEGYVIPNSFAQIEYNYNGTGWVLLDTVLSDANGYIVYWLPAFITGGATDFDVRIKNVTLNCDFGYSETWDII